MKVVKKERAAKLLSFSLTVIVLGLLVLSGPAEAFSFSIDLSDDVVEVVGEEISFLVSLNINNNERLPVDYLNLEILGLEDITCQFNVDGSEVSGCDKMLIIPVSGVNYTNGDLGGNRLGTNYDWGYGYGQGYGYGYGYGDGVEQLIYNITLNTSEMDYGTYETFFNAKIGSNQFSEPGELIIILKPIDMDNFKVHSFSESIYDSRRIEFNISYSERLERIEYINWNDNRPRWKRLCRDCDEYGFERRRTKSFKDGENNLSIRGVDEFGRVVERSVSFFIDSKKPRVSRTYPRRNSILNGSKFYVKYTEDNLKEVRLFYGNESEVLSGCVGGRNQECVMDVDLSVFDGKWMDYWFEVSDDINVVESRKTRVRVDVVAPVILNVNDFWKQGFGRKNKYIYFDIEVNEDNLDVVEYIDWNVARPRWRKLCSRLKDGLCVKKKRFKDGLHDVEVRVVDDAGNSVSERFGFDV